MLVFAGRYVAHHTYLPSVLVSSLLTRLCQTAMTPERQARDRMPVLTAYERREAELLQHLDEVSKATK